MKVSRTSDGISTLPGITLNRSFGPNLRYFKISQRNMKLDRPAPHHAISFVESTDPTLAPSGAGQHARLRLAPVRLVREWQHMSCRAPLLGLLLVVCSFSQTADISELRQRAEKGELAAEFELGTMYGLGQGVPQDYSEAMCWFRKAADQGYASAQGAIGAMYSFGQGVPQDYAEAMRWYRKAADQGNAAGQHSVGAMYFQGQGVPKDYGEAMRWFRRAADQGDADAQFALGLIYHNSLGVPQDYGEAARWFRKAADQGHSLAQFTLGAMYNVGQSVPQDYVMAHMWINLAASSATGDDQKQYARERDTIAAKMTPRQVAEAQRLAREWKPKPAVSP